jgi:hypothetical protein
LICGSAKPAPITAPFNVHATGLDQAAPGDDSLTTSSVLNNAVPDCPLLK